MLFSNNTLILHIYWYYIFLIFFFPFISIRKRLYNQGFPILTLLLFLSLSLPLPIRDSPPFADDTHVPFIGNNIVPIHDAHVPFIIVEIVLESVFKLLVMHFLLQIPHLLWFYLLMFSFLLPFVKVCGPLVTLIQFIIFLVIIDYLYHIMLLCQNFFCFHSF